MKAAEVPEIYLDKGIKYMETHLPLKMNVNEPLASGT